MRKTERKVELLAPADSMEALRAAVQNGCDAVYLGGSIFGAGAFASNFDEDEIQEAITYTHVYRVRVSVTVNTLAREEEFGDCVRYVQFLYEHDVDAVIIQDLDLFSVLRQRFPDMELHASTQMHIHNPQGIHFIESCGASRVVVPREAPLKEVRTYAALGVDLEVFVQEALYVSYSEQCLTSSLTLQRSENRGECAQNCRMKYQLEKWENGHSEILQGKGECLLNPRDMNTLERIPGLTEARIVSFKIGGGMKCPEYVTLMVALCRKAVDTYHEERAFIYDETVDIQMKKIFNHDFTQEHLSHHYEAQLMNPIRPNHIGVKADRVIQITRGKIVVRLQDALRQQDGTRILQEPKDIGFQVDFPYRDGLLVNHEAAGDIVGLDKTAPAVKGSIILKISDAQQLQTLQKSYEATPRKVTVHAQLTMQAGKPAVLEIMDEEGRSVRVESDAVCETVRRMPLKEERITAQLKKSGDTPFVSENISYQLDAQGILPTRELSQMHRNALTKLEEQRKILHKQRRILMEKQPVIHSIQDAPSLCAVVHTEERLQACLREDLDMIFVGNHSLYALMEDTKGVYPRMPRVMKEEYPISLMMVQETGGLQAREVFCDTSLNMTDSHTAAFPLTHSARGISFSLESSLQDCNAIKRCFQGRYVVDAPFFYTVYGKTELILGEYCPINSVICNHTSRNCGLCRQGTEYALLDVKQNRYPILCDESCRTRTLRYEVRNHIDSIPEAKQRGIQHFLYTSTIEGEANCHRIVTAYKAQLQMEQDVQEKVCYRIHLIEKRTYMVNLVQAKEQFTTYCKGYDAQGKRVALKIVHSRRVAGISKQLAIHGNRFTMGVDLTEVAGLHHNIGGFEQLKQYHTSLDAKSINHAALGVRILQEQRLLSVFCDDPHQREVMLHAVENHNKFQIASDLEEHAFLHATILRDADRTDIFRVNLMERAENIYLCSEEQLLQETISEEVLQDFLDSRPILSVKRRTHLDILLSHIAFIFDYHNAYTLSLVLQQHYIKRVVERYPFRREQAQQAVQLAIQHALTYIQERVTA